MLVNISLIIKQNDTFYGSVTDLFEKVLRKPDIECNKNFCFTIEKYHHSLIAAIFDQ